eukprot:11336309-Alexandrium_andersonii.AAC.1
MLATVATQRMLCLRPHHSAGWCGCCVCCAVTLATSRMPSGDAWRCLAGLSSRFGARCARRESPRFILA